MDQMLAFPGHGIVNIKSVLGTYPQFLLRISQDMSHEYRPVIKPDPPYPSFQAVQRHDSVLLEAEPYPAEIIPVRLSEIYQIDEAYEWVEKTVKELLKKDFQGLEEDIPHMQAVVEKGGFSPKKREVWLSLGIVLCVILANEVEGWEWRTLVDGNREAPVLVNLADGTCIDPMKLVWSRVKAGMPCNLTEIYSGLD